MQFLTEFRPPNAVGEKLAEWIVARVRITTVVFSLLVAESIFYGIQPHNPTNVNDYASLVGVALVALGLWTRSWAAGTLHKLTRLTTHGPYAIVRNPLYLGSFLMMIGFCILIDVPENIWIVLGPFLALFVLKVRDEERKLADRFGADWREYVRLTPRFLPRRRFGRVKGCWSFRQWVGNREYRAVGAAAAGITVLSLWHLL